MTGLAQSASRNEKVRGSNPLSSTISTPRLTCRNGVFFVNQISVIRRTRPNVCPHVFPACPGDPIRPGRRRSPDGAGRCSSSRSTSDPSMPEPSPDRLPWPATCTRPCAADRESAAPGRAGDRPLERRGVQPVAGVGHEQQLVPVLPARQVLHQRKDPVGQRQPATTTLLVTLTSIPSGAARWITSSGIGTSTKSRTRTCARS